MRFFKEQQQEPFILVCVKKLPATTSIRRGDLSLCERALRRDFYGDGQKISASKTIKVYFAISAAKFKCEHVFMRRSPEELYAIT